MEVEVELGLGLFGKLELQVMANLEGGTFG